jgi:glutamyl-tRNA reductase
MQRLLLLGLNHTTAPLEVRERLAFDPAQRRAAVEAFGAHFPGAEAVLLSTCNRVELYVGRSPEGGPGVQELAEFLGGFHSVAPAQFDAHLYQKTDRAVVEHLFSVSSSLDSMVLGETQILGQVREAYDVSREAKAAGPLLHPLFQRAVAVGKQVMRETSIGEGRLSVASVAVDYARQIFERFDDKTVLCVGAGKMTALVLQSLASLSPRRVLVCNRNPARAEALAGRFSGEAVPFDRLSDHLVAADIVVTSTGSREPVITRAGFATLLKRRRYRPVFVIDIAVPRDVEAAVGKLDNVYLYNLDDLQQVVLSTRSQRQDAADAAKRIVSRQVEEFVLWHRQRELGPTIDRLYQQYHRLGQEELARTLSKLPNVSEAEKAHLEELTRRIVNKLLHAPIQTLRESGAAGGAAAGHALATGPYLHALEKLFGLERGEELSPPTPEEAADAAPKSEPDVDGQA